MRIVLASAGSRGDVQPLQALGLGLLKAGHSVVLCAAPDFAASSAELGVPFVPVGSPSRGLLQVHFAAMNDFPLVSSRELKRAMRGEMDAHFDVLMETARGADLVVASSLEFAASSVAEALGIRYRYLFLCPAILPSWHHAPWLVPWRSLPGWVNRILWWAVDTAFRAVVIKEVDVRRRRIGLGPAPSPQRYVLGRRPVLAADDVLGTVPPDVRVDVVQTPALQLPVRGKLPRELDRFLVSSDDAGAPPVYFGFGSMIFEDAGMATRVVAETVRSVGRRAVISAGWAGLGEGLSGDHGAPGGALEGAILIGDVPHALLFPLTAVVVHHGGAGTTATAARAGVPQVIVPRMVDQFHWAERVGRAGLGPRAVPYSRLTARRLTVALEAALGDEAMSRRSREVAERLRARDGVAEAVAALTG